MRMKLIAIGNRLMGDDGLAIQVAEKLSKDFEDNDIEVIIGETDFQYCLSKIEEDDNIIILDAAWFGVEPGIVTSSSLKDIYKLNPNQSLFSQHGYSLIRALQTYYTSIDGMVVTIEGHNFDFALTLSSQVEERFEEICRKVDEIARCQPRDK
jgi:hydrogenase maturation protease